MYTIFAITMVVMGAMGLLVGWLECKAAREQVRVWRMHVEASEASAALTRGKIHTAIMDRIRNLETYRQQHTARLNEHEDLIGLLNTDHTFNGTTEQQDNDLMDFVVPVDYALDENMTAR